MKEPFAYLNGRMLPVSQAALPIYDTGVVLGAAVTEMTRTFQLEPFRLEQHLGRLFRSMRYLGLQIDLSLEALAELSVELVTHNAQLVEQGEELGVVQFVTAGEHRTYAGMAGRPWRPGATLCVHTFVLPFELWATKFETGVHVVVSNVRQVPPQCWDPKVKSRSRLHYYLAEREARQIDAEAVPLLLDLEGNISETPAANFLIVEGGKIVSPGTRHSLPGVSRMVVQELAAQLNIPFEQRDLQPYNVINADEAFLTSTPYCLLPVTRFAGMPVGDGRPGPVYLQLLDAFSREVGLDIASQMQGVARARLQRDAFSEERS